MRALATGEVHIWTAQMDPGAGPAPRLEAALSEYERTKAARFIFDRHRRAYVFAHAFLRDVLSQYIGSEPAEVEFREDRFGKPFLKGRTVPQFNMSHSGDVVSIALVNDRLIGVDVEKIRTVLYRSTMAESNFTPQERAFLYGFPAGDQDQAFFRCWCRKESYIKAVGKGLAIPLNTFNTFIEAGHPGLWLPRTMDAPQVERWWLTDLEAPEGYAGALTVEGGFERLEHFNWAPGVA